MFWFIHQEIVSFLMQSDEPNGKAMATIFVLLSLQAQVRSTEYSLSIILNQKRDSLGHRSRNSILRHVKFRTGQVCDAPIFFISARQNIIGYFCHSGVFGLEWHRWATLRQSTDAHSPSDRSNNGSEQSSANDEESDEDNESGDDIIEEDDDESDGGREDGSENESHASDSDDESL